MTLTETTTLHYPDGRIALQIARNRIDDGNDAPYLGTFPWEWAAPQFRELMKTAIARAIIGQPIGPIRYELDPDKFAGGAWIVESNWIHAPSKDTPAMGVSRVWSAVVDNLSPREREIARLLPDHTVKQIGRALKISPSTIETHRGRIGVKVGASGGQLIAWCQAHRDIL